MLIGYARTSTKDQKHSIRAQIEELERIGCERVYQEQVSSVDSSRRELEAALDYIRDNDTLIVTKLDRLARSVADIVKIQSTLERKNAGLKVLDMNIDTTTPTGKLQFNLIAAIAQFEREVMLERQLIGIERAKQEGKYKGRKPISEEKKRKIYNLLEEKKHTNAAIAKISGVGIATVYRLKKDILKISN